MPIQFVVSCWLLVFGGSAALAQISPAPQRLTPTGQAITQVLPVNPFPRANSVWLRTTDPVPVAMDKLVRYYHRQGYVVDTVDQEVFFRVQAHTLLQLPQRPVRLDVRASFGGSPVTVCLRATYANGPVRRVRSFPHDQPELLPAPSQYSQVRYTTFLAPARRAAFLELQRVSREAFPGALLTYGNTVH